MTGNERTLADAWFEELLAQEGIDAEREPDWPTIAGRPVSTNPDYLVELDGCEAVFEVKSFEPSPERDATWNRRGAFTVGADVLFEPIRGAI
jgi:hypothetical protein